MTTSARSQIIAVNDVAWQELKPGISFKVLWQDQQTKRRVQIARFEPGATLPAHRHVGDEVIFLLEGANADEAGVVETGNLNYRPNGCVHTVTTQNGATVLAVVWGRTEPV
jgi:anti-sigma factor ChrR (cupin superfamily)